MPQRNTRFRALKEEFRLFLDQRGAWPLSKNFQTVMENNGGGRKVEFTHMKKGASVAEKYVIYLAICLSGSKPLDEYLVSLGGIARGGLTVNGIVDLIAGPVMPHPTPKPDADDWFIKGFEGQAKLFTDFAWGKLVDERNRCHNQAEAEDAARMTLECAGHHIAGADSHLEPEKAIERAVSYMRITREAYFAHVVEAWKVAEWSVAFSVIAGQRVGCSRVVPLTDAAYDDMRSGNRSIIDFSSKDIVVPSRNLLLESVSERHATVIPFIERRTAQQLRTLFVQMAFLTYGGEAAPSPCNSFRLLGFGGTPLDEVRASKFGFRPLKTRLPGLAIKLMELDLKKAFLVPLIVTYLQCRLIESGKLTPR